MRENVSKFPARKKPSWIKKRRTGWIKKRMPAVHDSVNSGEEGDDES